MFLRLGELLRRKGQLDTAHRVAVAGLERHPHHADAHDLLARILADKHDYERAFDEWDMALRIAPNHTGALKGLAFLYFKIGDIAQAESHLEEATRVAPEDASVAQALAFVRGASMPRPAEALAADSVPDPAPEPTAAAAAAIEPPPPRATGPRPPPPPRPPPAPVRAEAAAPPAFVAPADASTAPAPPPAPPERGVEREPAPRMRPEAEPVTAARVFAGLEGAEEGLLLLDNAGRVLGGALRHPGGGDVTDVVAAYLAGVSQEASRTGKLLALGAWTGLSAEGRAGHVHLSLPRPDALLLVVRDRSVPLGRLAVLAERASQHAQDWLESQG